MINVFGKTLAFVQVAFSIVLMAIAIALYFNAVDFGWEQPARYFREIKGKKDANLLVPSLFDKREAALRKLVRTERDQLVQLGTAQENLFRIDMLLAMYHLDGADVLKALAKGEGEFAINDIKLDDKGDLVLKAVMLGIDPRLGFPDLATEIKGINRSYAGYLEKLEDVDNRITKIIEATEDLQKKLRKVTAQLTGELAEDGSQARDSSGAVKEPGWYYLLDKEAEAQRELKKEIDYLRPLWVKERSDSQVVLERRYQLMQRLGELGDKEYVSQPAFLKKQK